MNRISGLSPAELARAIKIETGLVPLEVHPLTDLTDADIVYTAKVSIQVSPHGSAGVVEEEDDGESFLFYAARKTLVALIKDLRAALKPQRNPTRRRKTTRRRPVQ